MKHCAGSRIFGSVSQLPVSQDQEAISSAKVSNLVTQQGSITAASAVPISRRELGVAGVSSPVGSSAVAAVAAVIMNTTGTPGYCHVDPNNELHGSVVTWGDTLIKVCVC